MMLAALAKFVASATRGQSVPLSIRRSPVPADLCMAHGNISAGQTLFDVARLEGLEAPAF
jgi:hypothetical protein